MSLPAYVELSHAELESKAYRSLDVVARALLIEMRSLQRGPNKTASLSYREAALRLNVAPRRAELAFRDLLQWKWIERASFMGARRPSYRLKGPDKDLHG